MTVGSYPQGVPEKWRIDPTVFASEGDIGRFVDVASALGVDALGLSGGSIVEDFDRDGDLDFMASSWGLDHRCGSLQTEVMERLSNPVRRRV